MEGLVGFRSAAALSPPGADLSRVLCWDSGGASFQICGLVPGAGAPRSPVDIDVYRGPLGSTPVTTLMLEVQGKALAPGATPNPARAEDAAALGGRIACALPAAPAWLTARAARGDVVVAIGGPTSAFRVAHTLCGGATRLSREDVWGALSRALGQTDEQLAAVPQADQIVPKLVLLWQVMGHCGFGAFEYASSPSGGCPGVMTTDEFYTD